MAAPCCVGHRMSRAWGTRFYLFIYLFRWFHVVAEGNRKADIGKFVAVQNRGDDEDPTHFWIGRLVDARNTVACQDRFLRGLWLRPQASWPPLATEADQIDMHTHTNTRACACTCERESPSHMTGATSLSCRVHMSTPLLRCCKRSWAQHAGACCSSVALFRGLCSIQGGPVKAFRKSDKFNGQRYKPGEHAVAVEWFERGASDQEDRTFYPGCAGVDYFNSSELRMVYVQLIQTVKPRETREQLSEKRQQERWVLTAADETKI